VEDAGDAPTPERPERGAHPSLRPHPDGPRPRRESAATYRRRRLAVAVGVLSLLLVVLVTVTRLGSSVAEELATDGKPPGSSAAPDGTTPADDPLAGDDPGDQTTSTSTTSLVLTGFANPSAYLACVRERESRGDYAAVSPDGRFFGAYQIDQVTWDNTATHAGLLHLYRVQPDYATPADQDTLAMALLEWQGTSPWAGDC